MAQAERVHSTQMPLNTRIITERNDGLSTPLEAQGCATLVPDAPSASSVHAGGGREQF